MTTEATPTALPVPFTREELRRDVLNIYLLQLRVTCLIANNSKVWELTGKPPEPDGALWIPESKPGDFGLRYSDIASTELAKAIEQQYDFAFHGVLSLGREAMEYESIHTWVAAYLLDLSVSRVVEEWESYGSSFSESINRCLHASELANARLALEGKDIYSYFASAKNDGKPDQSTAIDALTIRQMALLSGMEEMSVRTAASRKSANQLLTYKEEMRTLVRVDDAKAWLKAKGRYVPITKQWAGSQLNLSKTKFTSLSDFYGAVDEHVTQLATEHPEYGDLLEQIHDRCTAHGYNRSMSALISHIDDASFLKDLAEILRLPSELFLLRAEQARLSNDLHRVDMAIREQVEAPPQAPAPSA